MPKYNVRVVVEYQYEVEADNKKEAEEQGWKYEDYSGFAEVDEIEVEEVEDDEEEDE